MDGIYAGSPNHTVTRVITGLYIASCSPTLVSKPSKLNLVGSLICLLANISR